MKIPRYPIAALLAIICIAGSQLTQASTYNGVDYLLAPPSGEGLPSGCEFGRDYSEATGEVTLDQAQDAYQASVDIYQNEQQYDEDAQDLKDIYDFGKGLYSLWEAFGYLRIEGPNYVVRGRSQSFKGNLLDPYRYVNFYTNESGYVGRDKSNLEANSYYNLKFDSELGVGLVWVTAEGMCSAKGVWVHNAPSISVTVVEEESPRSLRVKYYVDNRYSRAVREGINPTITFRQGGATMVVSVPAIGVNRKASSSQKEVRIERQGSRYVGVTDVWLPYNGFDAYDTVTAIINDGQHSSSTRFRATRPSSSDSGLPFSGECPTPRCEAPWRKCSSLGGTFHISGSSYVCRAK